MLRHQIQHHGNKLQKLSKKAININEKSKKSYKRIGVILPESEHKIHCKLCDKEFFGQSRTTVMKHVEHKHDDVTKSVKLDNRYYFILSTRLSK